jgi:uncharacterized protein
MARAVEIVGGRLVVYRLTSHCRICAPGRPVRLRGRLLRVLHEGCRIDGSTAAVEDGQTWVVDYSISLDPAGCTRIAHVVSRSRAGSRSAVLETDGGGRWTVNGQAASGLDGCLDVDLESSAVTNALPVRRMSLATGERAEAPAAYVRAVDISVERLDQTYERVTDDGPRSCYDYTAPAFEFSCRLVYDESGLVIAYPGIAVRVL